MYILENNRFKYVTSCKTCVNERTLNMYVFKKTHVLRMLHIFLCSIP